MNQNNDSEPKVRRSPPQLFGNCQQSAPADFQSSILATITESPPSRNATRWTTSSAGWFAVGIGLLLMLCGFFYMRGISVEPVIVAGVSMNTPVTSPPAATLPDAGASVIDAPASSAVQKENALDAVSPQVSTANAKIDGINPATTTAQASTMAVSHAEHRAVKRGVAPSTPTERKVSSAGKAAKRTEPDQDVALLAAMLPYIATPDAPSSAELERRCGALNGEPARACRTRYCNGREGLDPACPRGNVR